MDATTPARSVLLIGGSPEAALAVCRALYAAGYKVGRLRWHARRTAAEASRACDQALYLGPPTLGVAAWCKRMVALAERERFDALMPLDGQAHELLAAVADDWVDARRLVMPSLPAYRMASDKGLASIAAQQSGWRTLNMQRVPRNGELPSVTWPCIVRPARAVAIVEDDLSCWSVREVCNATDLDAKLRDDLPRIDVLLQSPAEGEPVNVILAAIDGQLLGACVLDGSGRADLPTAPMIEALRALLASLRCTGLLRLECLRGHGRWLFVDLHFGPGDRLGACHRIGTDLPRLLMDHFLSRGAVPAAAGLATKMCPDPLPAVARAAYVVRDLAEKLLLRTRALAWREPHRDAARSVLQRRPSVLFVCKGNINRSLVAEQVMRAAGFTQVCSAGLLNTSRRRPSAAAEQFVAEVLRLPTANLRSRSVDAVLRGGDRFAHVVCFERRHAVELLQRHPQLRGHLHLLSSWAGERGRAPDIPDPHGGTESDYRRCFERIAGLLWGAMGMESGACLSRWSPDAP